MTTSPSGDTWPRPVDRQTRAHWWSIQPPPPAGPISARRAYGEVLGVFAAFFAASIIAGGETLAHRYPPPSGSWAVFGPAAVGQLATSGLAIAVVVLLSARRGISPRLLGLGVPAKADGPGGPAGHKAVAQSFRIGVWAVVALVAGGLVTGALATGKLGQPAQQDASYLLYTTAASLSAGIVEETVVLAFLVTTLRQAGRPLAEIVAVAVLLRCSYHDYYGPGVLGIAIWAAAFAWLYLRLGSVIPLIVVHFLWDATIFLGQQPHWKHGFALARTDAYVLLPVLAAATWLWEVMQRQRAGPPPPGEPASEVTGPPGSSHPSH